MYVMRWEYKTLDFKKPKRTSRSSIGWEPTGGRW